jgi:hypothetical protein
MRTIGRDRLDDPARIWKRKRDELPIGETDHAERARLRRLRPEVFRFLAGAPKPEAVVF